MTSLLRRAALICIAAIAYLVGFWPTWQVRDAVLSAFGNPPYQGLWLLIPHVFLYSTLPALFCFVAWIVLVRAQWMQPLRLSLRWRTLGWGLAAGLVSVAAIVGFFFATGQAGAFHAARVDAWNMAANLISNFYEE